MVFPVSGVETPIWLPLVVAFVISFFTSMAGLSGAFLLLPFQMSFLGFTSPAVSPTNLVFNIVAIPSGVLRYMREGRMIWPLTWVVVAGTLPGVVLGAWVRITYLPDPGSFKVFVGCVLFYLGSRMFWDLRRKKANQTAPLAPEDFVVHPREFNWRRLGFDFQGQSYSVSMPVLFTLSLAVGVIGGIYGIGGGAMIAPFYVAICGLPIHAVAGAVLMGTFVTSVAGVAFFQAVAPFYAQAGLMVAPDWLLGSLFGLGGLGGMYLGARLQRLVPALWLKALLAVLMLFVAVRYLGALILG